MSTTTSLLDAGNVLAVPCLGSKSEACQLDYFKHETKHDGSFVSNVFHQQC